MSTTSSSCTTTTRPTARPAMANKLLVKPSATATSRASSSKTILSVKDTSSSSGTVFAKPSKEWVIPDRAKPGRKVSVEEPDNKRQSQNRQSQRAHRARRTDYISTLEERIRQFEADEIHSNVRLQEVARALKADNERLKAELESLKSQAAAGSNDGWEKVSRGMEEEIAALRSQIAKLRGRSMSASLPSPAPASRPPAAPGMIPRFWVDSSLPTSKRKSAAPLDCPICPNPDPDCPCQTGRAPASNAPSLAPSPPNMVEEGVDHACGLCQSHEECLCRVVDDNAEEEDEDIKPFLDSIPTVTLSPIAEMSHDDSCGLCTSAEFCACKITTTSSPPQPIAPPTATSVPLRRRDRKSGKSSIWALLSPSQEEAIMEPAKRVEAVCTGDPSNCEACKDDSFGREFCSHLFAADAQKCAKCSGKTFSKDAKSTGPSASETHDTRTNGHDHAHEHDDTMRPEQAWKALKAHPNAKLASLALLADVIARRTVTCSSSPDKDSPPLPEDATAPASPSSKAVQDALEDVGARKGKRRVMIETTAVRDALRMLDSAGEHLPEDSRDAKRRRM